MKRSIVAPMSMIAAAALAGSCVRQDRAVPSGPAATEGWIIPPSIEAVDRTATSLTVRGQAVPLGRVVLRGDGSAYAASADDAGRFQIRIRPPTDDSFMSVEVQTGQTGVPAPYRLMISREIGAPIAMISPGAPTVRLDPGAGLDVIDGDGRAWHASGRAAPERVVALVAPGSASRSVTTGPDGRWTTVLSPPTGPISEVSVDGRRYIRPASGEQGPIDRLVRSANGWMLTWRPSATATRTSWFPDREASGS